MPRSPFVVPEVVRLPLPDDHWLDVKARLTFGEQQALNAAGVTRMSGATGAAADADEVGLGVDLARWMIERIHVWLVDWSFRDAQDKPVAVTRDAIRALDPDWARTIQDALDQHIEAAEAKKATPTPNGRTPTGTT